MRRFLDWLLRRKRGIEARGIGTAEVHGYKNQAETRLGRNFTGSYILVEAIPGLELSNDRPWLGRRGSDYHGVATGIWRPGRITLYTTNGRVRPSTGVHEWAHEILHNHRVPIDDHHRVMRQHGIP